MPAVRQLVESDQVLAVGADRVALGGGQVPDGVGHRDLVDHFPRTQLPLRDGAVDEQRRVRVAVGAELRVERPEAHRHLGILDRLVLQDRDAVLVAREVLVLDRGLDLLPVERGGHALELARPDDVLAVGSDVDAVRRLAAGHEVDEAGDLLRIEHLDPAEHVPLAGGGGLLGDPPVDGRDVVAIALGRGHLELAGRTLGVVRREEHPAVGDLLAGVPEVVVEGRHQDLPANRHLTALRVDLDPGDHALVVGGVLGHLDRRALRQRNREARRHHGVLRVGRDERRAVVARHVGHRADDLLGLEVAQVDARNPTVHLVDEQPATVVVAVGLRQRRVVHIAPGQVPQHLLRLVVEAVAGGGVGREDGNRREVPHRRHAVDVHLARVPARCEEVVLVEVPRRDVRLGRRHRGVRCRRGPPLPALGSAGGAPARTERERRDPNCHPSHGPCASLAHARAPCLSAPVVSVSGWARPRGPPAAIESAASRRDDCRTTAWAGDPAPGPGCWGSPSAPRRPSAAGGPRTRHAASGWRPGAARCSARSAGRAPPTSCRWGS